MVFPYIDLNLPWVYMCSPSWNLPSTSLPIPSLWVIPVHQPWAPEHPVSCVKTGLAIHFTYDNLHVSMPFSHIILPSPSPIESKTLFYTSVSLSFFFFLTLQYCIGFAIYQNESATGIHVFSILNPPPSSFPIPSLWVIPVHQPQASSIVHWTWTGESFHIWYYTCFNSILPNHPTLSLSHRVQKTILYICVSFAVSYTGLLLPSF